MLTSTQDQTHLDEAQTKNDMGLEFSKTKTEMTIREEGFLGALLSSTRPHCASAAQVSRDAPIHTTISTLLWWTSILVCTRSITLARTIGRQTLLHRDMQLSPFNGVVTDVDTRCILPELADFLSKKCIELLFCKTQIEFTKRDINNNNIGRNGSYLTWLATS